MSQNSFPVCSSFLMVIASGMCLEPESKTLEKNVGFHTVKNTKKTKQATLLFFRRIIITCSCGREGKVNLNVLGGVLARCRWWPGQGGEGGGVGGGGRQCRKLGSTDHGIAHPPRWSEGWFWRGCRDVWHAISFCLLTDARRGFWVLTWKLILPRAKSLVLCSK